VTSGQQDDNSSVSSGMEDMEAENARLMKDLDLMRAEARLAAESEALKQENLLLKQQCDEFRRAALNLPLREADGFGTKPGQLPKKVVAALSHIKAKEESTDTRTTVMLRSFPNNYSSTMLLELIDSKGFKGCYDFMYLPMDFMTGANLGYCFLNFTSQKNAQAFTEKLNGFSQWKVPSKKCCAVVWSDPHQGLQAYIERYRNSPIMHQSVPVEYKPALFKDGERVAFPPPTKNVRAPRVRYLTNS
jgi:hypothetical protein